MKTIEEIYNMIEGSEELQKEAKAIKDKEGIAAFLKKYDCDASVDEFTDYIKSQAEGELSDEESENVNGGLTFGFVSRSGSDYDKYKRTGKYDGWSGVL